MAPTTGDVLRITAKMSWGENAIQNVYHAQITGAVPSTNEDLVDDIAGAMEFVYTNIDEEIPNLISFDTVEVYNLTADEYVGETNWPTLVTGGQAAADPLPPQVAPLILFNTGTLNSQGRKFLPSLTDGNTDTDGTVRDGTLTLLTGFASALMGGAGISAYDLVFGNYRPLTQTFIEWISAEVRDIFATQRRRYFGRGA